MPRHGQPADVHALVVVAMLLFSDLTRPQAAFWYQSLLAESGYGRLPRERAAFLIRETDGTLTLEPWPPGERRHATFRGRIPAGTIAILHTHPHGEERPSAHDRDEAVRLRMPVVAITTGRVVAAMPDGGEVVLVPSPRFAGRGLG
ncbi:MAG: Mov34/MPN/PAD-1 family protein [Thermoanaerobaculia bacterium]